MTLQDETRALLAAATLWPWTDGTPAPELLAALCEQLDQAEEVIQRARDLADWHETKADKARLYPGGRSAIMQKAAQVHDDAARRLRAILEGGE